MKRRLELQSGMNNILTLDNPKDYRCRVTGYLLERSLLVVEASHETQTFYVIFPEIQYFDGPFLWHGASLRTASRDEQFEYMLDKSVATLGMLYIFDGRDAAIHLLCGDWIAIFDNLPARFK